MYILISVSELDLDITEKFFNKKGVCPISGWKVLL